MELTDDMKEDEDVSDSCPVIISLWKACGRIGLKTPDFIKFVIGYPGPTENYFNRLRDERQFEKLAYKLREDYRIVPLITPPDDEELLNLLQKNIRAIIDFWFELDPDDPDDYKKWTPKDELINGLNAPEGEKHPSYQEHPEEIRRERERYLASQRNYRYPRGPMTHIHEVKYCPSRSALMVFGPREYPSRRTGHKIVA
jgi:hypothetical protein